MIYWSNILFMHLESSLQSPIIYYFCRRSLCLTICQQESSSATCLWCCRECPRLSLASTRVWRIILKETESVTPSLLTSDVSEDWRLLCQTQFILAQSAFIYIFKNIHMLSGCSLILIIMKKLSKTSSLSNISTKLFWICTQHK